MKKIKKMLDVVFLLDRSGSMHGSEEDTIGGFNNYLKEQRKNNSLITTILFDDCYEELYFRKKVSEVKDLTSNEYFVKGCTALYDAIGKTINKLDKEVKNNKVLFIITTDGLENASCEYDKKKVNELIKKHSNWEFIYLGANIDAYKEGASIGIKKDNISNYSKSSVGMMNMFKSVSYLSECIACNEDFGNDWKKGLEEEKEC